MSVLDEVRTNLRPLDDEVVPESSTTSQPRRQQSTLARRRAVFREASRGPSTGVVAFALAGGALFWWWWKNRKQPGNKPNKQVGCQMHMVAEGQTLSMVHQGPDKNAVFEEGCMLA